MLHSKLEALHHSPGQFRGLDVDMLTPRDRWLRNRPSADISGAAYKRASSSSLKGAASILSPLDGASPTPTRACKTFLLFILDHKVFTYIMTSLTIYALFGDDVRLLIFTKPADSVFNILTLIAMFAFICEIAISSIAKREEYLFSFYFWLDLIATLSLIFDISWLWDMMTGVDDIEASSLTQLMRAGRGARVGTKAGRIVRIVRILRLVRIMKLYKHSQAALKSEDESLRGPGKNLHQ